MLRDGWPRFARCCVRQTLTRSTDLILNALYDGVGELNIGFDCQSRTLAVKKISEAGVAE
jgi:hypothetical protein